MRASLKKDIQHALCYTRADFILSPSLSLSPKKGSKQGIMHYDGEPEQQNIVYSSCRYFKITRIALRRVERLPKSQRCAGCYVGQLESYAKRIRMLWQCGKKIYTTQKLYIHIQNTYKNHIYVCMQEEMSRYRRQISQYKEDTSYKKIVKLHFQNYENSSQAHIFLLLRF